jgi:hypothetical protein
MRIPDVPIIPILIIVGFVVYPFAISGIALFIAARSGRRRFLMPVAIAALLAGCIPIWIIAKHGLGKIPSVTVVGSAVFLFGAAATGLLLGAIVDLFVSKPIAARQRPAGTIAKSDVDDEDGSAASKPT